MWGIQTSHGKQVRVHDYAYNSLNFLLLIALRVRYLFGRRNFCLRTMVPVSECHHGTFRPPTVDRSLKDVEEHRCEYVIGAVYILKPQAPCLWTTGYKDQYPNCIYVPQHPMLIHLYNSIVQTDHFTAMKLSIVLVAVFVSVSVAECAKEFHWCGDFTKKLCACNQSKHVSACLSSQVTSFAHTETAV
jgi:hypothetical protein